MSTDAAAPQARPRASALRWVFAPLVVLLAVAVWIGADVWPNQDMDSSNRSIVQMLAALTAGVFLLLWALRMPGWSRKIVWAVGIGLFGVAALFVKPKGMQGKFLFVMVTRDWVKDAFLGGSDDTLLERHREAQGKSDREADLKAQKGDVPDYRGVNRDGVVEGPMPPREWSVATLKEVWRQPVGGGYAGFAYANGYLVTIEQRREKEVVACYEAATGKEVWTNAWDTKFDESLGGPGPRATPTVAHGDVFALGAEGRLVCMNGQSGQERWAVNLLENNKNIKWGQSGAPLVVDDLVIVNPGAQTEAAKGRAVRAYDRKTGKEVWATGDREAGYSSPELVTLGGKKQVLIFDAAGLAGYHPQNGTQFWRFSWPTYMGINVAQPLVIDDQHVFISAAYQAPTSGGALIKVVEEKGTWSASKVWQTKSTVMRCKFTSPVRRKKADGDYIYGLNDGILECIDLKDGKQVWKDDRRARKGEAFGHGQIALAGDLIVALTEFGELVLAEADPKGFNELARFQALNRGTKTWNIPTIAHGRIYVRNDGEMACFDWTAK